VELPRLEPLYQKFKDQGFTVIAIEAQRDTEGALKFIEENNLTYTTLENGEEGEDIVRSLFGVGVFPTSFLVDEEGRILYGHIGFDEGDEETFEKEILSLLGD
jgi:peroxiredoxin